MLITALFAAGVVMSFYGMSYAGYYTDKVICWIWLLATVGIIIRLWKMRIMRIYAISIAVTLLLSVVPMMIPFFGIVFYFTTTGDYQQIDLNNKYRLEYTTRGVMARPEVVIIENHGLLEKTVSNNYVSALRQRQPDGTLYRIEKATLRSAGKDSICISYIIGNTPVDYCDQVDK